MRINCNVEDSQSMITYANTYKAYTYDFSNQESFKLNIDRMSEDEAKQSLRILVDFMKNQVEHRGDGLAYEPLLSQLVRHKDLYLV
jgi:hypothetical protein